MNKPMLPADIDQRLRKPFPHAAALFFLGMLASTHTAFSGSATWKLNPTSNDWHTAQNWTPENVPDQTTDVATFDVSNVTNVNLSWPSIGIGGITFNPGASAYFISAVNLDIAFFGQGVVNNSGITQNISPGLGFSFGGIATAGTEMTYTSDGSELDPDTFGGSSNAGSATFILKGNTTGHASALLWFFDTSSAANSTIVLEEANPGTRTEFLYNSTAGNSTITVESGGVLQFDDDATAGAASLMADGGTIYFLVRSNGQLASVDLTNGGTLNLNSHDTAAPMSIGSLEGDSSGVVLLGPGQLTVGGNGLNTTFNGQIRQAGSLIKTGNEKLTLAGANTYSGGSTITAGTLLVQTATGSGNGYRARTGKRRHFRRHGHCDRRCYNGRWERTTRLSCPRSERTRHSVDNQHPDLQKQW